MSGGQASSTTIAIVDLGNDIQLTYSVSGYVYTFNKLTLRVKQTDKWVFITNSDSFNNTPDNQVLKLDYKSVSSPVYESNDELYAGIIGMTGSVSLGGGASAGGGASVWSTKQGDFSAVITDSTKNITVTGLSWTLEAENVAIVEKIESDGSKSTVPLTNVVVSGGVITLADADDFATGDVVSVTLIGPDKAYDQQVDAQSNFVLNPDSAQWTSAEHLVAYAEDAVTSRYVIQMEGFKDLSTHRKITAGGTVTLSLWATNNSDADDSADTDWVDVTADYWAKAVSGTSEVAEVSENIFFQKLMIKVIGTGTTNVVDIYIKKKAL